MKNKSSNYSYDHTANNRVPFPKRNSSKIKPPSAHQKRVARDGVYKIKRTQIMTHRRVIQISQGLFWPVAHRQLRTHIKQRHVFRDCGQHRNPLALCLHAEYYVSAAASMFLDNALGTVSYGAGAIPVFGAHILQCLLSENPCGFFLSVSFFCCFRVDKKKTSKEK